MMFRKKIKTDLDLPPAARTQATFWRAEASRYYIELVKANKGIRRLVGKLARMQYSELARDRARWAWIGGQNTGILFRVRSELVDILKDFDIGCTDQFSHDIINRLRKLESFIDEQIVIPANRKQRSSNEIDSAQPSES